MSFIDDITVVMTTSLVPTHPRLTIVDETLNSLIHHLGRDIINKTLMCANGLKADQLDYFQQYEDYNIALKAKWPDCRVEKFSIHTHQTEMLRKVMPQIGTPLIFWIEHDWPLTERGPEPWPWKKMIDSLESNELSEVRFNHGPGDGEGSWGRGLHVTASGLEVIKTTQFLGMPGLGRKDFFEKLLNAQYGPVHLEHTATRRFCELDDWKTMRMSVWPSNHASCYSRNGRAKDFFINRRYGGFTPQYTNNGLQLMIDQGSIEGRIFPRRYLTFPPNSISYLVLSYDGELIISQSEFWDTCYVILARVLSTDNKLVISAK